MANLSQQLMTENERVDFWFGEKKWAYFILEEEAGL